MKHSGNVSKPSSEVIQADLSLLNALSLSSVSDGLRMNVVI